MQRRDFHPADAGPLRPTPSHPVPRHETPVSPAKRLRAAGGVCAPSRGGCWGWDVRPRPRARLEQAHGEPGVTVAGDCASSPCPPVRGRQRGRAAGRGSVSPRCPHGVPAVSLQRPGANAKDQRCLPATALSPGFGCRARPRAEAGLAGGVFRPPSCIYGTRPPRNATRPSGGAAAGGCSALKKKKVKKKKKASKRWGFGVQGSGERPVLGRGPQPPRFVGGAGGSRDPVWVRSLIADPGRVLG